MLFSAIVISILRVIFILFRLERINDLRYSRQRLRESLDFFEIFFGFLLDNSKLQQTREYYRFGEFRLDESERRLWYADEPISLKPKQFDLLFYFVRNHGRTATKSELLDAVWADAFVEETTLARNVSWLRNTLGKYADDESIIETVPKLGYRFTPQVEISEPDEETIIVEKQTIRHFRGEETITIDDAFAEGTGDAETRRQGEKKLSKFFASPRLPIFLSPLLLAAIALVALAGIASYFYWNNAEADAMSSEPSANAKTKVEKIEIAAAREFVDSGIKIQRGDFISFSVAGEFKYGKDQTWTFEGDKNADVSNDYFFEKAAPWSLVGWIGTETDQSRYFQVSNIYSLTADRNGTLYFAVNKPQNDYTKNSGALVADVMLNRNSINERPNIKIGSIINLQNRYPNVGGYLDAWGTVFNKPEFKQVSTETMFVSTHYNPNRDNGSGSWEIVSADGKSSGEPLLVGDRIHLRNKFPDAGYLDSCGWVADLPVFKDFKDQTTAIFTAKSPNRDYGSGTWIVRSAAESDGSPVLEGDSIALENGFIVVLKGKVYKVGFLNVSGNVKDIASFNDYDGSSLVFSQDRPRDQPVPDIWTVTVSKAISK